MIPHMAPHFVQDRWMFESQRASVFSIPEYYLLQTVEVCGKYYSCNRPPGAAGAALVLTNGKVLFAPVFPPDLCPSCHTDGCDMDDGHCVRTVHAERRAILWAARLGWSTDKAIIYSILKPCHDCTKELIVAGIKEIYYAGIAYDLERTKAILAYANVTCEHIEIGLGYGK